MSLYLQINVVVTPHQRSFYLQQAEAIIESYQPSKCTVRVQFQLTKQHTPKPKAQGSLWKALERLWEPEGQRVCYEIVSPGNIREAVPMKFHQHSLLTAINNNKGKRGHESEKHQGRMLHGSALGRKGNGNYHTIISKQLKI